MMADLQNMARTFSKESEVVSAADTSGPQSTPDGGNTTVTSALAGALQAAGLTTKQFSEVVANHGTKLNGAYRQYRDAEESNVKLCQQLTSLMGK
jgi:acyl transferase domain-containing protein